MTFVESTKNKAMKSAKALLQTMGFNGFSFQHVADELGIKKPSLYDHFKSKEELGNNLIDEYLSYFRKWTETVETFKSDDKINGFFDLIFKFSSDGLKYCPMTALCADFHTLPKSMKKSIQRMGAFQMEWMLNTIQEGQKQKIFRQDLSPRALADVVFAMNIGSQMLARISENPEKIRVLKKRVMGILQENVKE